MKVLTNLKAEVAEVDCDNHPVRQAARQGIHFEMPDGTFRFLGVWDKELHLHHGKEIVVVPLAELWGLAETHHPEFKNPRASDRQTVAPIKGELENVTRDVRQSDS